MLDIAQLCKTNCHSRNYFRLIEQHGTLKVQIYMNLNFIWLIFNANVNCNAFKVEHENLSTIISKSVINNLAVTFFQYVFMAKSFYWKYKCAVSATSMLKTSFLAYVLGEIWQN